MEGSSPPQEIVFVEGDIPPKDSVPSEGRSPSLVSYDDEDVEDSEAPHPSSFRESEVPPSPRPLRSSEVPPSSSTQSIESVQPLHATKVGTGVQPPSSQKDSEVPTSSPYSESEVPLSHQLPSAPTVRSSSQNPVVPASGFPLTSTAVSGVNNLSVFPPQARDSAPSASNLPSYFSEEQRKRYEQIFSDLVDYEGPFKEFSFLSQPHVPPTAPSSEIDKVTGEVSKEYLERHFREGRNWRHRERLDRMIQARRGTSSTPAQSTPTQTSYHASSSVHQDIGTHRPFRTTQKPSLPRSNKRPPFYGPKIQNELGLWISPRINPYLADEKITPESFRNDAEPTYGPRPGCSDASLETKITSSSTSITLVPTLGSALEIIEQGSCSLKPHTEKDSFCITLNRHPDHIVSYCGPDHRRSGNLQRALQLVIVLCGCIESRMLKWAMVEGRIEKSRWVQPAISSHQVPAQIEETKPSPEPHQREAPPSLNQPMETSAKPIEPSQLPTETDEIPSIDTSNQSAMDQADNEVITVSSDSHPITPVSRAPHQSPFSGTYESSLLLYSMIGSRNRDDRRRDRPKRPYLEAADLRDADKILKLVNKFILWSRTDRVLRETRGNVKDPAQIALANEVARLREELEQTREGSQPLTNEYFGNITGEPVHEWDLFRQAMRINPRGLAECVTPEVLNALRYQNSHLVISSPTVPTPRDERIIWVQILRRTQFSRLDETNRALLATNMDWTEKDYGNKWINFMVNIGRVLTRSTATQEFRGISQQVKTFCISSTTPADRLPDWVVATHVLESIGIVLIRDRVLRIWCSPFHYPFDGQTLGIFFSVLQIEYDNFCNARSFMEQLKHVDFTYQNQITHQQASRRPPTVVPYPPDIPRPRGSGPGKRPKQSKRGGNLQQSSSQAADVQCNFCKQSVIRLKGVLARTAKEARSGESNKLNSKLEAEILEVLVSVVEEALAAEAEALHLTINVPVTTYVL
ncbi:hypothetical protein P9112_014679 [Eukaryota sp. TZLM1-RC]